MKDNELVRGMYSRLNLIINELNSIGINKLGDADIVRKIIFLLPQQRYGSIITILHNREDLSTMTPTIVIEKIAASKMSRKMGRQEEPTSSRPYAFACDERKGKKKAPTPSSSSEEEEEESDDDEDNQPSTSSSEDKETIRRVGKVMEMNRKINLMDVPLQVEDLLFNIDRKKQRKRGCFACREKGHFRDNCTNMAEPTKGMRKGKALTSVKTWDDSSSEDEPPRTRSHRSSSHSSRSSHKCLMARVLVKNIVVETCSNEVAKENEQLRQEVARLDKTLYDKKGKAKQIQLPQDNATAGVNKPVEEKL
jgi:hypothetical protein